MVGENCSNSTNAVFILNNWVILPKGYLEGPESESDVYTSCPIFNDAEFVVYLEHGANNCKFWVDQVFQNNWVK